MSVGWTLKIGAILGVVWLALALGVVMVLPQGAARPAAAAPPAESPITVEEVVATVLSYVENERPDDPLVQVADGVWAKRSNYFGITIGGTVYYYALFPHASFDPLSRGAVSRDQVRIVRTLGESGFRIIIYVIRAPGRDL